jgi:hypothetical protein
MTDKPSCATCVYFKKEPPNPKAVGMETFTCRAYPPQLFSMAPGNVTSIFPFTAADGWCGEWTAREERKGNA